MTDVTTFVWRICGAGITVFMLFPLVILALFAFSDSAVLAFPIQGLTLDWFAVLWKSDQFWSAFENSVIITATVGTVSTITGTMAAMALSTLRPKFSAIAIAVLSIPTVLPPLVLGVALLSYYVGAGLPLGLHTVIFSHLVFTQPFIIMIVQARMAGFSYAAVDSARDLGAGALKAFMTVTLPIIQPTIIGAALVGMALSLDDFIVTFFTIGSDNTLSTLMWGMLRKGVDPRINVVALVLITLTMSASVVAMRLTKYRG
jgi:spermidine/putrescine transport system permease protein